MNVKTLYANSSNYTPCNARNIEHIVLHYTANNGDTAEGNGKYFAREAVGASAHYFVDENNVVQAVRDKDIAWHCESRGMALKCGCRNSNSIGIEMCSNKVNGAYVITAETVTNAVELVKILMNKYNIPVENVLRHYDVCGKTCPEPFVRDTTQWTAFKKRLEEEEMEKTAVKINVNGTVKTLEGFNVDGTNYVTVRALCELLGVTVGYDSATKTVVLSK